MPKKPVRPLRARSAFSVPGVRGFQRGDLVRSDDPVVEGREHLFEDILDKLDIEQATANPGQKRAAKKPVSVAAEAAEVTTEKEPSDG